MDLQLQQLLLDMADDSYRPGEEKEEGVYESDKTVSWAAYERARRLSSVELLPFLYDFVRCSSREDERGRAYFLVRCIAHNTNDLSAAEFLLDRLSVEKSTELIVNILDSLAEVFKPTHLDLSIIYKLIEKKGARIRRSAYSALTNSAHQAEDRLLDFLQNTVIVDDIVGIVRALGYIGTKKSVAPLARLLKSRKSEVKHTCQNTLPTIMVRENYPVTEICRAAKVSTDYVQHRKERLELLTRPG
ncbi:MAG: hypothetical protein EOP04_12930 [Proteobacteria bacterium]|nr:MAG: hypothetical protein EOP04_12930 [Pseudomonadota bacterium]